MNSRNNIDEVFQEGIDEQFHYDENLWQAVEPDLPFKRKKRFAWWQLNLLLAVLILPLLLLIPSNQQLNSSKKKETLIPINNANPVPSEDVNERHGPKSIKAISSLDPGSPSSTKLSTSGKANNARALPESNKQEIQKSKSIAQSSPTLQAASIEISNDPEEGMVNEDEMLDEAKTNEAVYTNAIIGAKEIEAFHSSLKAMKMLGLDKRILSGEALRKKEDLPPVHRSKPIYVELQIRRAIELDKYFEENKVLNKTLRESSESYSYAQQQGLMFFKQIGKLQLGLGLRYSKLKEVVDYEFVDEKLDVSVSYDTNYRLINSNYNPNGEPIWLIKEEISSIYSYESSKSGQRLRTENTFDYIQIPVSIGYDHYFNRVIVGLRTGLQLNYLIKSEGAYISEDRSSLISLREQNQLSEINLGAEGELRLGYGLNEFILLGTHISYQQSISSVTESYRSGLKGTYLGVWLQFRAY